MRNYNPGISTFKNYLKSPTLWITIFSFLLLYVPVLVIIIFSFNSNNLMVFPLREFSLQWYRDLFSDRDIIRALRNSVIVGFTAVFFSGILGVSGALALYRYKYRFNNLFKTIINFPLILPGIMTGLSLLIFFNYSGIGLSLLTVIIAHMTFCIPTIFKTVLARLRLLPKNIVEASMDLYASYWRTIIKVILPSIRTSIITGYLLAFTLSFDETLITLLVTGNEQTLPMAIWGMMRRGFSPEVNALATMMFLFSITVAVIWGIQMRRSRL